VSNLSIDIIEQRIDEARAAVKEAAQ